MCRLIKYGEKGSVAEIKFRHLKNIELQAGQCQNIARVILFGSSIEERCTDKSDIDIAVFGKQPKNKYLLSREYKDFRKKLFQFDFNQDYDILYFEEGKEHTDTILNDIRNGVELYRRAN